MTPKELHDEITGFARLVIECDSPEQLEKYIDSLCDRLMQRIEQIVWGMQYDVW